MDFGPVWTSNGITTGPARSIDRRVVGGSTDSLAGFALYTWANGAKPISFCTERRLYGYLCLEEGDYAPEGLFASVTFSPPPPPANVADAALEPTAR